MGKYNVNISFSLAAQVEPDGYLTGVEGIDGVLEYDENNYMNVDPITAEGGDVWVTVEAENADEAGDIARDLFDSNASWEGDSNEWEITDSEVYDVQEVTEPMTLARALELVNVYLEKLYAWADQDALAPNPTREPLRPSEEVREAFEFLIETAVKQNRALEGTPLL